MTQSRDEEPEPRPGLSIQVPFVRGPSGEHPTVTWNVERPKRRDRTEGSAGSSQRPAEERFPRLGEPTAAPDRIPGAWGWAPLIVFLLLFLAFVVAPQEAAVAAEEADDTATTVLGFAILSLMLLAYIAGAIAAFRGNRKGLTWTLPLTCVLLLLVAGAASGDDSGGGSAGGALALGIGALIVHTTSFHLSRTSTSSSSGSG
jgi:hypothetical protein